MSTRLLAFFDLFILLIVFFMHRYNFVVVVFLTENHVNLCSKQSLQNERKVYFIFHDLILYITGSHYLSLTAFLICHFTGISDIIAAFQEAIRNASQNGREARQGILQESSIEDKAQILTSDIETDGSTAIEKIQDALQHLVFVVFSTTLKS